MLPIDPSPLLSDFAHSEALTTTSWLDANAGSPGLVVLESDEDVLLYDTGHIPGALKIDWHADLSDPLIRDLADGAAFTQLMRRLGIRPDTTVVIYGDRSNWWAAYAFWVFKLFGHDDVRLLNGGRALWVAEGRPLTQEVLTPRGSDYPEVTRTDHRLRAFAPDVAAHSDGPIIDVRSPGEYSGEVMFLPDYPLEGTLIGGHVPGALNVPWGTAARPDGTFKSRRELDEIYRVDASLDHDDDVIVYCRIGERSAHTWFVLHYLVGIDKVRNYDGSWAEWGNLVRAPIERGNRSSQ